MSQVDRVAEGWLAPVRRLLDGQRSGRAVGRIRKVSRAIGLCAALLSGSWERGFAQSSADRGETTQVPAVRRVDLAQLPSQIAFGSCAQQDKPQPVLDQVLAQGPDLFIYLGDNIYGDTRDMEVLRAKYQTLGAKPEFQRLRSQVPVLATWDDHDYGENDAGREYPLKAESREIFLDFWQVPAGASQRQRAGIFGEYRFSDGQRVLQVLILDTRTFRDPLQRNPRPLPPDSQWKNGYQPLADPNRTLLGEQQWQWLEEQLRQPADVRIIASSIQFGHEYNGYESWTNVPLEQRRMFDLIRDTGAAGVVFITGDVHWGEISRREQEAPYPVFDVTASGITETWSTVEPNRYRVGNVVRENHFGQIRIQWEPADPLVTFQLIDRRGVVREATTVPLSQLRAPSSSEASGQK